MFQYGLTVYVLSASYVDFTYSICVLQSFISQLKYLVGVIINESKEKLRRQDI